VDADACITFLFSLGLIRMMATSFSIRCSK
jgi:hypothetical protein